jgi:hypothetical protein
MDAQFSRLADGVSDAVDSADLAAQQAEVAVNIGLATHESAIRKEQRWHVRYLRKMPRRDRHAPSERDSVCALLRSLRA